MTCDCIFSFQIATNSKDKFYKMYVYKHLLQPGSWRRRSKCNSCPFLHPWLNQLISLEYSKCRWLVLQARNMLQEWNLNGSWENLLNVANLITVEKIVGTWRQRDRRLRARDREWESERGIELRDKVEPKEKTKMRPGCERGWYLYQYVAGPTCSVEYSGDWLEYGPRHVP